MGLSNAGLFRTIVKKQKRIGDAFPVSTNSRMFAYIISSAMDVSFRALDGLCIMLKIILSVKKIQE